MAIKSPKNKGSSGEREAIALLTEWAEEVGADLNLDRNLEQVRYGGSDINGVPGLEIEVKRVESNGINGWWKQVCTAARKQGTHPFLMHRRNRQPWRIRTGVYAVVHGPTAETQTVPMVVDMELDAAKAWFQAYVELLDVPTLGPPPPPPE